MFTVGEIITVEVVSGVVEKPVFVVSVLDAPS